MQSGICAWVRRATHMDENCHDDDDVMICKVRWPLLRSTGIRPRRYEIVPAWLSTTQSSDVERRIGVAGWRSERLTGNRSYCTTRLSATGQCVVGRHQRRQLT